MKKYKGVVFFDFDGTLIDEVDGIFEMPESTKDSLMKLRENGYATCVCSGRTKLFSEEVKDYFDGYVTGMGAHVELDGEVINSVEITTEEIEEMCEACAKKGIIILMDGANQSYCNNMDGEIYQFFKYVFHVHDHWVIPWTKDHKEVINKLTFMYDNENTEAVTFLEETYGEKLELAKHIRYGFTDATPKGVDKGTGIVDMLEYLGLPIEASYGFGDGDNDLPLVKTVGTSVIMGRHYSGLEPYATMTTGLVKEDGIKQALTKLGLI